MEAWVRQRAGLIWRLCLMTCVWEPQARERMGVYLIPDRHRHLHCTKMADHESIAVCFSLFQCLQTRLIQDTDAAQADSLV